MSSSATRHFISQRVSAVLLVALGMWFAVSISGVDGVEHAEILAFIANPLNSVLLMALSITITFHSYLGVQMVIEDYVHATRLCRISLITSRAAHIVVGLLLIYTVFEIAFGA